MRTIARSPLAPILLVALLASTTTCVPSDGCRTDIECKGDRICQAGLCVDPNTAAPRRCFEFDGDTICHQDAHFGGTSPAAKAVPYPSGTMPPAASVDITGFKVPNQGQCGSCTAFAVRNAMGIIAHKDVGAFKAFSPSHIWFIAGYNSADCDFGSDINTVVLANANAHTYTVDNATWPYSTSDPISSLDSIPDSATLASNGIAYINNWAAIRPHNLDDIKSAIAQGWPAVVWVDVYLSHGWLSTGHIVEPPSDAVIDSTHSIAITQYDDAAAQFTFANSWGKAFGKGGFGTLSYEFMSGHSHGGMTFANLAFKGSCPPNDSECSDSGCVNLQTDPQNCGACNVTCPAQQVCAQGACACPTGTTECGSVCALLAQDPANCGTCAHKCAANQVCADGQCVTNCGGLTNCGAGCVNLQTDAVNCGQCPHVCQAGEACIGGQCTCVCGNGTCSACENCASCPQDCGPCCGNQDKCSNGACCTAAGFSCKAVCPYANGCDPVVYHCTSGVSEPCATISCPPGTASLITCFHKSGLNPYGCLNSMCTCEVPPQ